MYGKLTIDLIGKTESGNWSDIKTIAIKFNGITTIKDISSLVDDFIKIAEEYPKLTHMNNISISIVDELNIHKCEIPVSDKAIFKSLNKLSIQYEIKSALIGYCNKLGSSLYGLNPSATKYNLAEIKKLIYSDDPRGIMDVQDALGLCLFSKITNSTSKRSTCVTLRLFGGGRLAIKKTGLTAYWLKYSRTGELFYFTVNPNGLRINRPNKVYDSVLKVLFLNK